MVDSVCIVYERAPAYKTGYCYFILCLIIFKLCLGLIKLAADARSEVLRQNNQYNLTVIARDDGSCCPDGPKRQHSATAQVYIG